MLGFIGKAYKLAKGVNTVRRAIKESREFKDALTLSVNTTRMAFEDQRVTDAEKAAIMDHWSKAWQEADDIPGVKEAVSYLWGLVNK